MNQPALPHRVYRETARVQFKPQRQWSGVFVVFMLLLAAAGIGVHLWVMPLDGTAAKNLTNGAGTKGEIRVRYVRTEPSDAGGGGFGGGGGGGRGGGGGPRGTIDLSKPITLSAYGEWTKKSGYYTPGFGRDWAPRAPARR